MINLNPTDRQYTALVNIINELEKKIKELEARIVALESP